MNEPAPAAPVPSARLRLLERLLLPVLWVFLTVHFFFPATTAMDVKLDNSNYGSYALFTATGAQYGPEIVPMAGPYGFVLYGFVYSGHLFWTRLALALMTTGALAALMLWFVREHRGRVLSWAWLFTMLLFCATIEDAPIEWALLLAGLFLLRGPESVRQPAVDLPVAALLGFLALFKGTQLTLAVATLGVVLGHHAFRREWRRGALLVGGFVGSFVLFWLLAGQRLGGIPSFLRGILELSSGYNDAMAFDETPQVFRRGLVLAGLVALLLGWAAWVARRRPAAFAAVLLLAGFSFVQWKHGYVRADGHVFIFFQFVTVVPWVIHLVCFSRPAVSVPVHRLAAGLAVVVATGGLLATVSNSADNLRWWAHHISTVSRDRIGYLLHAPARKAALETELARRRENFDLPRTRQAVGTATIDLFGFEHGIIPLNGLNYAPRPMGGGSFNVYNRYLMERNREYVHDPARRPAYFLVKLQTIDQRLLSQDDALTLDELLQHYTPVLVERGHLLLRATDRGDTPARVVARRTGRYGENVPLPPVGEDELLFARFHIRTSALGRLRRLLYKPSPVFINLDGQNLLRPFSRNLIPAMAAAPLALVPALENNIDFLGLYLPGTPAKPVASVRLALSRPADYRPEFEVEFLVRRRPAPPEAVDIAELIAFERFPIADVLPIAISSDRKQKVELSGLLVQQLHAPGTITWRMEGTERELLFDYGLEAEVWQRGASNGVIFRVELERPGSPPTLLFERLCDPCHRPADRGSISARVVLPPLSTGTLLHIRTDPGEFGDTAWDWAYLTNVQFKRGPFSPKQFPRFSHLPTRVDCEYCSVVDLDSEKLLLLHAPGELTFELRGTERRLRFAFGFLPNAYTDEGRTDGAEFIVELVRPNRPREELFRRHLRPREQAADQGRQIADIVLPPLGPADRLRLRTAPGPAGSNSWDWTYLTDLRFE